MKRRWWIALGNRRGFSAIGLIVGLSVFFEDPINQQNCEKPNSGRYDGGRGRKNPWSPIRDDGRVAFVEFHVM